MRTGTSGRVEAVFVGAQPGGPVQRVPSVEVVVGRGIVGDRYFSRDEHDPVEEVTLFASEDVHSARSESGVDIDEADLRRNIMTSGLDLSALHGAAIQIGQVVIDSLEENPPCSHLQRLAGKPILKPLVGRGGFRGRIVRGGSIRVGDPVQRLREGD